MREGAASTTSPRQTTSSCLRTTSRTQSHSPQESNCSDGVTVTADDYVFTNMATAITETAYVGGGTTLSIIGNQDQFTYLNGTTDYVNSGVYQHGGSAPWTGAASSVWTAINATAFSFHSQLRTYSPTH